MPPIHADDIESDHDTEPPATTDAADANLNDTGERGDTDKLTEQPSSDDPSDSDDRSGSDEIAGSRSRRPAAEVAGPGRGVRGALRFGWAVLTSMRTAITLLLVLAVAAMPGGLLPQRPNNPFSTNQWIAEHPTAGPILDRLGMFDVYHSAWFAAIYLLLFISLVGCILPRTAVYLKAARAPAAAPPRAVPRLRGAQSYRSSVAGDELLEQATVVLRKRRYRTRRIGDVVAAERGYLREAGNLAFHIALLGVLVSVGYGNLTGYHGSAAVVEGQGFANTLTQYDDFTAGAWFNPDSLDPFSLKLDNFAVRYETGPVQTGAARDFTADITVTEGAGTRSEVLKVNQPLTIDGTSVHLVGHGYAPVVTVRDGNGNIAFSGPVIFQPLDGNLKSAGVIKAFDARPQRLAFEGFFLPTATVGAAGPVSLFPDALAPQLFLTAWTGPPTEETGVPTSVFTLDTTGLTQATNNGDLLRFRMNPGESFTMPDGSGTLTFDGYRQWTKLQISHTPGLWWIVAWIAIAVAGMTVSLTVRPRRIWMQVADDGFWIAGADRVDGRSGVGDEAAAVATELGGTLAPPSDDDQTATGSGATVKQSEENP